MKKLLSIMLLLCLFLTGCGEKDADKPSGASTEPTPSAEPTTPNLSDPEVGSIKCVITNDVMTAENQLVISGIKLSDTGDSNLSDRFEDALERYGTIPDRNYIMISFTGESPLNIVWSADDGYSSTKNGTAAPNEEGTALIELGYNLGALHGSNLDNIPNRQVRIVCEYADRSVEYLLVLKVGVSGI